MYPAYNDTIGALLIGNLIGVRSLRLGSPRAALTLLDLRSSSPWALS